MVFVRRFRVLGTGLALTLTGVKVWVVSWVKCPLTGLKAWVVSWVQRHLPFMSWERFGYTVGKVCLGVHRWIPESIPVHPHGQLLAAVVLHLSHLVGVV